MTDHLDSFHRFRGSVVIRLGARRYSPYQVLPLPTGWLPEHSLRFFWPITPALHRADFSYPRYAVAGPAGAACGHRPTWHGDGLIGIPMFRERSLAYQLQKWYGRLILTDVRVRTRLQLGFLKHMLLNTILENWHGEEPRLDSIAPL